MCGRHKIHTTQPTQKTVIEPKWRSEERTFASATKKKIAQRAYRNQGQSSIGAPSKIVGTSTHYLCPDLRSHYQIGPNIKTGHHLCKYSGMKKPKNNG